MITIIALIIWVCLAPVIDGLIYPDLIFNKFQGSLPLWVYLSYFGMFGVLCLFALYEKEMKGEDSD